MNAKFNLELEYLQDDGETVDKKTVEVIMQSTSPVIVSDIFAGNRNANGGLLIGSVVEQSIGKIIMSPKNLMDKIGEADNAVPALQEVFNEINQFCYNPKKYVLLQRKSEQESNAVGESSTQPDTNGNQPA